jgi:5-methylcytosine-specific restriction endonuclease McrA
MPYKDLKRQRQYQREWMARRRADWLSGKACAHCGRTGDLQVDHIDPGQKLEHKVWSWSASRRKAELAKCQVLCERCHQEKSLRDRPPVLHGTHSRYVHYGCRCAECKKAHAVTNAKYRTKGM